MATAQHATLVTLDVGTKNELNHWNWSLINESHSLKKLFDTNVKVKV